MNDTQAGNPEENDNHDELAAGALTGTTASAAVATDAEITPHPAAAEPVVPTYPDHIAGEGDARGGILLGLALLAAAIIAAIFLYTADDTERSTFVARAEAATATAVPATAVPATATAVPATAVPEPTAVPAPTAAPDAFLLSNLAGQDARLGRLGGALGALGLVGVLEEAGPRTVFAPNDAAFGAFDGVAADLDLSDDQVSAILAHHLVDGTHPADSLVLGTELTSLADSLLIVGADGSINGANVVEADLPADNGLMHVIDGVIIPTEVLTLRQRLLLESNASLASGLFAGTDVAAALDGDGPVTIFVPSNDAVTAATLPSADADAVVRYHLVAGSYMAADLTPGTLLTTSQGETIVIGDGPILDGTTEVVTADLIASNGVAHIVDTVLVPGTIRTETALNDLFALDPIQFAVGSAQILPASEATLNSAIEVLTANIVGDVTIEGHTDTDGGEAGNQSLSQARAESVLNYLSAGGVDAERLTPIGYGETRLKIDPEVTAEDKAQNRRIEFVVE